MAGTNDEPEVKDIDVVHIEPAGKDAEDVDAEDTDQDSSPENEGEADAEGDKPEGEDKPDALSQRQTTPPEAAAAAADSKGDDDLAEVEGETPRERALRRELTTQRRENRRLKGEDLGITRAPAAAPAAKKELTPEKAAIIGKYKPEEIAALREVVPVLAEEMGFVRGDELAGTTYAEKAQDSLDTFLEKHPEYQPQNDKDGTLWEAFKTEYGLYKQPSNPKDFAKIFERIHRDVFGIKPAGALQKVNAQKEKINVASHKGASSAPPAARQRSAAPQGLRVDMLKGFDQDELDEITGGEE